MSWLQILQLAMTLMQQAMAAFAMGHKKEDEAKVALAPHQVEVVKAIVEEHV
jgi:hypothetical protein